MKKMKLLPIVAGVALVACAPAVQAPVATTPATSVSSLPASNPFAAASTLPYEAPDFTKIHDSDYEPAFIAGMAQNLAEITAIANQTAAPTFDNTILQAEKSGALLTRVSKVFNAITGANTNDTLQAIQERIAPKLAAHFDAIFLNDKLYQRVKSIYDRRDALGLNQQQKALVVYDYRNFVRAGANLSETDKAKLRDLNQEESKLTTDFQNRLLAATKAGALVIDDVKQLDGMSPGEIAATEAAAKQRNLTGKWVIPLQNTTQHPAQASLKNRAVRERLFMFHEFGHALHGMFSNVQYPSISGANTPRDFVEFPSQFNEHWASEPTVFANYAKHYKTGAPMPAELVTKIKNAKTFNQGFATTEYLAASLLDIACRVEVAGNW